MKEYVLSINKYEEPKEFKDKDSIALLLMRLIILEPGSIQTHPNMGVGIVKNWRYSDMTKASDLEMSIENQIATYLPMLQGVKVEVKKDTINKRFIINITVNEVLYSFNFENENLTINDLIYEGGI